MSKKVKQKERKPYMTDSRRADIVSKAILSHVSPGEKFKDLLPKSYEILVKHGIALNSTQQLRHLYSTFKNDNKVNYVVILLESASAKFWALWELEFNKQGENSYATPIYRGFIKDTPFLWI